METLDSRIRVRFKRATSAKKGENTGHPNFGDAVIIGSEEKNRNLWKLGIVDELIRGREGVARGAKARTAKGRLERAVQHLNPLELSCDREPPPVRLNPLAPIFNPRPKRDAAAAATVRTQQEADVDW